jgi:peptide/nickel transport system ATP-binding protein
LDELKRETGTAVVLITHDLGVVADHADQVAVMYAGRIAEAAPAGVLFARPEHPYTVGLLGAAPSIEGGTARLASIEGTVPDPRAPPPGCRFGPRCPFVGKDCTRQPPLVGLGAGHLTACWRAPLDTVLAAPRPSPLSARNHPWAEAGSAGLPPTRLGGRSPGQEGGAPSRLYEGDSAGSSTGAGA